MDAPIPVPHFLIRWNAQQYYCGFFFFLSCFLKMARGVRVNLRGMPSTPVLKNSPKKNFLKHDPKNQTLDQLCGKNPSTNWTNCQFRTFGQATFNEFTLLFSEPKDKSDYKLKDGVHCVPCPVSPFWAPRGGALEALNDFPKLRKHGVRASSAFTSSH